MKTLIIHPDDASTDFLKPIYESIPDNQKTVVTGNLSYDEVHRLIDLNDQIIMCGHGSVNGLFSIGQFDDMDVFDMIISDKSIEKLNQKKLITIWCFASTFIENYNLNNVFSTGMFCSEIYECLYCGMTDITQQQVDESNSCFSEELRDIILLPTNIIYEKMKNGKYAELAKTNPVAAYNLKLLKSF